MAKTKELEQEPGEIPASALGLLERIALGVEKLSEDMVINVETKPPHCPTCQRINPNVTVSDKEATGDLSGFVIQARCNHCQSVLYALPIQWECYDSVDAIAEAMKERDEQNGLS